MYLAERGRNKRIVLVKSEFEPSRQCYLFLSDDCLVSHTNHAKFYQPINQTRANMYEVSLIPCHTLYVQ